MNTAARDCLRDLEAIPAFLAANDAGVQLMAGEAGSAARSAALETARVEALAVETDAQGDDVIRSYLRSWREGHLHVDAVRGEQHLPFLGALPEGRMPRIEFLSDATALLSVPSFFPAVRERLGQALDRNRSRLQQCPNWIVDVRGNDGGADTSFAPLLDWLMPDGWVDVSEKVHVTAANLRAEEEIWSRLVPADAATAGLGADILGRLRGAAEGQWVQQQYPQGWQQVRPPGLEPNRPSRVAVIFDARCGSTCEQFLLTVRQSFNVKLVAHGRSAGVLDVSNLRPHLLPSGKRQLWYATTVSNRLPRFPIDGMGICPDVFLPWPEDGSDPSADIQRTRAWLEQGRW